MTRFAFAMAASLFRPALKALDCSDEALAESIIHHCALRVAGATAPTEQLVGRYVHAEITAKNRLLRMPVNDLEGIAVKGRYLRALNKIDRWELDDGALDALIDGMARAHHDEAR